MASSHRFRNKRPTPADAERRRQYASPQHRRLKASIQAQIDRGLPVHCWRCGNRITGHAWHLGHDDHDRTVYRGAECVPCNLRAAARKGGQVRQALRRQTPPRPARRRLLG